MLPLPCSAMVGGEIAQPKGDEQRRGSILRVLGNAVSDPEVHFRARSSRTNPFFPVFTLARWASGPPEIVEEVSGSASAAIVVCQGPCD
jgi:hypothetical protein